MLTGYNPEEAPVMSDVTGLAVRFYLHPVKNEQKSLDEGRPIYEMREYIEIWFLGTNDRQKRPAYPDDRTKYRASYAEFQQSQNAVKSGTSLAMWPMLSAADVLELNELGIYTLESLAEIQEHAVKYVAEKAELARQFLASAKDGSEFARLQSENAELKRKNEVLNLQISKLEASLKERQNA